MLSFLLQYLFPTRCNVCNKGGARLCVQCEKALHESPSPPQREAISARFDYDDPLVRHLLFRFKYGGQRALAGIFAEGLCEVVTSKGLSEEQLLAVAVPSRRKTVWRRGYVQSEELCKKLCTLQPGKLSHVKGILKRDQSKKRQTECKSKREREQNARGMFYIQNRDAEYVRGKTIVVVDDVTTTGATLAEARRVLKKAGAERVYCIAVAYKM